MNRKPTDAELQAHVDSLADDPRSKYDPNCIYCREAERRGIEPKGAHQ